MFYKKVLAAVDFSEGSLAALQRAAALAKAESCELHLVHVIPALVYRGLSYTEPTDPNSQQRERAAAEEAMTEAVTNLGEECVPVTIEVLEGEPRVVIPSHAHKIGADLIVLGSMGRGRLRELLLGSVTAHISHAATCSVLIVKSQGSD